MKFMTDFSKMVFTGLLMTAFLSIPLGAGARSIDVEVQNFPETQMVEDALHPTKQPYYFDDSTYTEIEGRTSLSTGVSTPLVPEGKKLVVQYISFNLSSTGFEGDPVADFDIIDRSTGSPRWVVTHTLMPRKYNRAFGRTSYIWAGPINLVVEAGCKLQVGAVCAVTENTLIEVGVSGYLVDAE